MSHYTTVLGMVGLTSLFAACSPAYTQESQLRQFTQEKGSISDSLDARVEENPLMPSILNAVLQRHPAQCNADFVGPLPLPNEHYSFFYIPYVSGNSRTGVYLAVPKSQTSDGK